MGKLQFEGAGKEEPCPIPLAFSSGLSALSPFLALPFESWKPALQEPLCEQCSLSQALS